MVRIIFVEPDGSEHITESEPGMTLMEVAVNNMVPSILAECGGACSCATCHIYIGEPWAALLPDRGDLEASMLELAEGVDDRSRLGCQIRISPEMDLMRVDLTQ